MKRVMLMLLPLLCLSAQARSWSEIRASGTLRLASSGDYPPFNDVKGSKLVGFEIDLGNLLAKQLGLKPVWVKADFDSLLTNFKDYDVVIASHAITSTRAALVDFTQPHYCTANRFFAKQGGPLNSKALENKTLGAESGSVNLTYLQKFPFQKKIKVYGTSEDVVRAVATGEIDAAMADQMQLATILKTYSKANLVGGEVAWKSASGMAVEKGNTLLRDALNTVLTSTLKDGSYNRLSTSYFGEDIRC